MGNENNSQNQVNNLRIEFITFLVGLAVFLGIIGWAFGWFSGNSFVGTWECKRNGYIIIFRDDKTGTISDGIITENFTYKVDHGTFATIYQPGKEDKYASMNDNKDAFSLGIYTYSKK